MSWLFGYKKPSIPEIPEQNVPSFGDGAPPGNEPPSTGKPLAGRESIYKFDSTALERAAKAAKELERSGKSLMIR